jgi:hypothetical protein
MLETPHQRKTRLIYEKAAESAARWEQNKRTHPRRISEQQKLDRVKARQIEELEARSQERVEFYNSLAQRRVPIVIRSATTFVIRSVVSSSSFLALFSCTFTQYTYIPSSTIVVCYLGPLVLITMMNMDITSKSAYKLLQQLESDPQLQSIEGTTI